MKDGSLAWAQAYRWQAQEVSVHSYRSAISQLNRD